MDLHPSEHILYEGRPSWRSILLFYILGLIAAAIGGAIAGLIWDDPGWGSLVAVLILIVVIVAGWVRRVGTRYFVTNERLHIRRGIISRRSQETRLERIQNVNTDQSVFERVLRIGTVSFDPAGGSDYAFAFRGVADPSHVGQAVDRAIREVEIGPETARAPEAPPQ